MKVRRLFPLGGVVLVLLSAGCDKVKEAAKKKVETMDNKQKLLGVWTPVWTGAGSEAGSPPHEFKNGKYWKLDKNGKPMGWTANYKVEGKKLTITWPEGTELNGAVLEQPRIFTQTIMALDEDHMILLDEEGLGKGSKAPPHNFARLFWKKRLRPISNKVKIVGIWTVNGHVASMEFTDDGKLSLTDRTAGDDKPIKVTGTYKVEGDKLEMDIGGKTKSQTIKTLTITDLVLVDESDKKTQALSRYRISMPAPRE